MRNSFIITVWKPNSNCVYPEPSICIFASVAYVTLRGHSTGDFDYRRRKFQCSLDDAFCMPLFTTFTNHNFKLSCIETNKRVFTELLIVSLTVECDSFVCETVTPLKQSFPSSQFTDHGGCISNGVKFHSSDSTN